MRAAFAIAIGLAASIGVIAACAVDVNLAGKGCPCPDGLLCDTSTNTCVTSLPVTSGDGGSNVAAACGEAECKCTKNEECLDPKRGYCGPGGTCVECLAAPNDTCSAGGYCNDKNQCIVGCKGNTDCQPGLTCNTTTHRCVECSTDTDCGEAGATAKCSPSGKCAESCSGDNTPCGTGGTCCGGLCISTKDDENNCGACGTVCSKTNNSPACTDSKCVFTCANGFAHCSAPDQNSGCETNVRSAQNCGGCGKACTSQQVQNVATVTCTSAGTCGYTTCQQGHLDKDKNVANGCEASCGGGNQDCCPSPQKACSSGDACRPNGTCPPQ